MRVLVTGSSGHLGEALVRTLRAQQVEVIGLDILHSPFTTHVGSITDAPLVHDCMQGVDIVMHTATLHKPHVVTHSRQAFIETNITGTLTILEAALAHGVSGVIMTSTTSTFGEALRPAEGQPAAWITEDVIPIPKNIYGMTKTSAEELCHLFYNSKGLPCIILKTSRFFQEADDSAERRQLYSDLNLKANEYLHRRVDIADIVDAHILAGERIQEIGFGRYIVSATTPFQPEHLPLLRTNARSVVRNLYPDYEAVFQKLGWTMFDSIDRVYVNHRAQQELGWTPRFDFRYVLDCLKEHKSIFSNLANTVGSKGYHADNFDDGPYPVERNN